MRASTLLPVLLSVACAAKPEVFWIRHGEKPDDGNGLSPRGEQRAQCLVDVFSASSAFDIGLILAQTPQKDGSRERPYLTVKPLADSLGLKVDTSCDRDDPDCVKDAIKDFDGPGNVLVCWEHKALQDNMEELGAKKAPEYPDDSFDLIYPDVSPYDKVGDPFSEACPGLDDGDFAAASSTTTRRARMRKRRD